MARLYMATWMAPGTVPADLSYRLAAGELVGTAYPIVGWGTEPWIDGARLAAEDDLNVDRGSYAPDNQPEWRESEWTVPGDAGRPYRLDALVVPSTSAVLGTMIVQWVYSTTPPDRSKLDTNA